jgi:hypothetical protein
LDSIGVNGEAGDINGVLYGAVNFSAGTPEGGGNHPPDTFFVDVGFEIEYVARWGESTGSTPADWHASNLTDDGGSGSEGPPDFRQAGEPHGFAAEGQFVETSQGVPYGTQLLASLGSPNFAIRDGDYNPTFDDQRQEFVFDGVVDGADLLAWQRWYGFGEGGWATREHGDGSLNRTVDDADLGVWERAFGAAPAAGIAATLSVPEPASVVCGTLGLGSLVVRRRRALSALFSQEQEFHAA